MIYNKHNLAVAGIADPKSNRPEITGVFFTKDKTVATDTFSLVEVSTLKNFKTGFAGTQPMAGAKPFIVPAKQLSTIKADLLGIKHLDSQAVDLVDTNGNINRLPRINDKFPDYETLFPGSSVKPFAEVYVNAKLLIKVLKVLGEMNDLSKVKISLYGTNKAVVLKSGSADQEAKGLLMPMI